MTNDTTTENEDGRQRAEREAANRAYNEALKAVEQTRPTTLRRPVPIPPPDDHQLATLNWFWAARAGAASGGWRGLRRRAGQFTRSLLQLLPWRHQALNAALVDHLNRASAREHAARDAVQRSLDGLHDDLGAVLAFQSALVQLLIQIPSYSPDVLRLPRSVAEVMSALGDEMRKRWESVAAREQRLEAAVEALAGTHERDAAELRVALGMLQRSGAAVKREVERALTAVPLPTEGDRAASQLAASPVDSYRYVGFEDAFRGSPDEIRARLASYLPLFSGASDVLDLGCGRGEFLHLLREHDVTARGVDINHEMVEACREQGLDVAEGDGLALLEALPDGALGGLFASQVIEHLPPDQLMRLIDVAFHKLRPGARVVLETVNPACWYAFFESYVRDITHVRPVHPETLKFLLQASGFQNVDIRLMVPYPERAKLQPIVVPVHSDQMVVDPLVDLAETFNENVDKLNRLMFTYLDYAAVGVRP
jgi:SAM-dependent methyltransferase